MKLKEFKMDRKDAVQQSHFNAFATDRRLNKAKMRELLIKKI